MDSESTNGCCVTRRGFLLGAGAGLAAGVPLTMVGMRALRSEGPLPSFTGRTVEVKKPALAMPGPYPGRVVEVTHPGSVSPKYEINAPAVKQMMDRGMRELTGADHAVEAWRRFFDPDDIVGIKVNPVGRKANKGEGGRIPTAIGSISSPEVLIEVVEGLKSAGVKPQNIIVFERYAREFREAGYEKVMGTRPMDGTRWFAASSGYDDSQLNIDGIADSDRSSGRDPHVVGYDPDVFVHMGYTASEDKKDDRRFRSHLTVIVTKMVNKFITIPVLKDHRTGGVTLSLKNLSHGFNNNVARSHLGEKKIKNGMAYGTNQCGTFIPTASGQLPLRQKATLHIMDGLIGVYEGGPGCWNASWAVWPYKSLFFATDPVAMDHVGWDIIDTKRAAEGWEPVARMGALQDKPGVVLSRGLATLAGFSTMEKTALAAAVQNRQAARRSENFDRRQPEHVILAGSIGMGVFNADMIEHKQFTLTDSV